MQDSEKQTKACWILQTGAFTQMATAVPYPLLKTINGRLGSIVFYNCYNTLCIRSYIIPRNPDTQAQRIVRRTFAGAVKTWQTLTNEEKYKYNRRARRMNMSGYNLYISQYMKANLAPAESTADTPVTKTAQRPIRSVSCPFPLRDSIIYGITSRLTGTWIP